MEPAGNPRRTTPGPPVGGRPAFALLAAITLCCAGCPDGEVDSRQRAAPPSPSGGDAAAAHCPDRSELRRAFFGELHLHSAYSMDAWLFDTRADADTAYRFARGEAIRLPPLDATGQGTRVAQLERPLDFASVTDHAEYLGPLSVCTTPGSFGYDSQRCAIVRGDASDGSLFDMGQRLAAVHITPGEVNGVAFDRTGLSPEVCGADEGVCRTAKRSVWQAIQSATQRHDSPCRFTTLHGYEYSAAPSQSKLHRNVIFRNDQVPDIPVSSLDEPEALGLWQSLARDCNDAGTGCEALAIPHNSNLSNGRSFTVPYRGEPLTEQIAHARLRARMEPLVEVMQIKGDSECRNGMFGVAGARDELCEFEKLRQWWVDPEDCEEGVGGGALAGQGCASRLDFVRYALIEGLREADRIGVNPYKLGLLASTDAHNGNPGDVEEYSAQGWAGSGDATPEQRVSGLTRNDRFVLFSNPGGLVGVWAEENRRAPIFDALRRRETFGTSGPRIEPRFFGGWHYPDDLCEQSSLLEQAYADGVSMGADLPAREDAQTPVFVAAARRDAGTAAAPGGKLQRIQIIKGWVGDDGRFHQAVYDVAGEPDNGASVDPRTCKPRGRGADTLCSVWRDPDFDPARRSVYYARVAENPSCRWNAWQCLDLAGGNRPASCDDPSVPTVIQERAWTSPIWYEPSRSTEPGA